MRLLILARYWNDIEWVEASLKHIEQWKPHKVVLSEGNWDPTWEPRSVDGTREILDRYSKDNSHVTLIDNCREDANYRVNQATTSNQAMEIMEWTPGDWMLIIDCDHFYLQDDINTVLDFMECNRATVDYLSCMTMGFITDLKEHQLSTDLIGTKIPYKLLPGCRWVATNHLTYRQKFYSSANLRRHHFDTIYGYHYERMRLEDRHTDKYNIGDRKTPEQSGRFGELVPCEVTAHPEIAVPVLQELGYL
jgi:hypothetical protein